MVGAATDSNRWQIRPAGLADLAVLTDLCFRSKQSNGYREEFMAACRDELRVTAASLQHARYWLVTPMTEPGVVCACAALSDPPDEPVAADGPLSGYGEVRAFFVDPTWQRQGVGLALWTYLLARARDAGMSGLQLDADPNAVPFYESVGFVVIGQSESGSIPGRLLPLMSRPV